LSRIYKSARVTIDKEHVVTIDAPYIVPEILSKEPEFDEDFGEFTPITLGEQFEEDIEELIEEDPPELIAKQIIDQAEREAVGIITSAKHEADDILDKARVMADAEREAAAKEGYDTGYSEGLTAAEQMKESAKEIVAAAYDEKEEILSQAEPIVVELISRFTKKLLLNETEINPDVIGILVKSGLSQTTLGGSLKVRVSSEDYANALSQKEQIMSSFEGIGDLEFFEDLALPLGGCIIETDFGSVDASMDKQCNELIKNLNYLYKNR